MQVAVVVFVGATYADVKHSKGLVLAGLISLSVGLLKELGDYFEVVSQVTIVTICYTFWDTENASTGRLSAGQATSKSVCAMQWWPGRLSLRDIGADLVGTAVALTVVVIYLTMQQRKPEAIARARLVSLYEQAWALVIYHSTAGQVSEPALPLLPRLQNKQAKSLKHRQVSFKALNLHFWLNFGFLNIQVCTFELMDFLARTCILRAQSKISMTTSSWRSAQEQRVNISGFGRMALVPYRTTGPAADQSAEMRIIQIGQYTLRLEQVVLQL